MYFPILKLPEVVPDIQAGLRQYLHRMTVCLGEELLPFVPSASQVLLKSSSVQSLSEYIPLINQIIAKFKVWILLYKTSILSLKKKFNICFDIPETSSALLDAGFRSNYLGHL